MVISHNILAMNNSRQQKILNSDMKKSTEKLSSGYQINRAADNAAGLSLSEKMRKEIRGLNRASQNIEEGASFVQTADGALNEVHDMLQRMNELSVQAANGTNSETDRKAIDAEVQHLKTEMNRIFETTKFNSKQIWEENIGYQAYVVGTQSVKAVQVTTQQYQYLDISNDNYDVVAYGSYKINANDAGVSISWKGYDGNDYETDKIDWVTLKQNGYKFQIADYFKSTYKNLFKDGKGVFDFQISLGVHDQASKEDIIKAVDGTTMSSSTYTYISGQFEDGINPKNLSVYSASLTYAAAYASRKKASDTQTGYDFNGENDNFIEAKISTPKGNLSKIPGNNTSSVSAARGTNEKWEFSFDMDGIGTVKATISGVSYYSHMYSSVNVADSYNKIASNLTEYEGKYWNWSKIYNTNKYSPTYISKGADASLAGVMDTLTGDKSTSTPGLLTTANGGDNINGGVVYLNFALEADNEFQYGDTKGKNVGGFTLRLPIIQSDTEQAVLDRINASLNSKSVFDLYATKSDSNSTQQRVYKSTERTTMITVPKYNYREFLHKMDWSIQAGTTVQSPDKIRIIYDCLRTRYLGLTGTNVLTQESATRAIDEVASALQIVSKQRAKFGAYQNRLEHAYNIDTNTEENTQYAESKIRDTDMNSEIVRHSNISVLQQAAQSMLVQANQSHDGVMSLLAG